MRMRSLATLLVTVGLAMVVAGVAYGLSLGPLNDLFALGQGSGDTPAAVPVVRRAEPPLTATPLGPCGPGSHPQPGIDGRVPAGSAANGLNCNISVVSHQGTEGGFKVLRYVDTHGHECAFYDTTLLFPLNALNPGAGSSGVAVLDMSDPAHPKQTDTLRAVPMLSPHESLNLNVKRGLLAAVNGNPATAPGLVAIYDAHADCRHPVLDSTSLVARFGHESGFSADGRTFYATSTGLQEITAVDVTNPKTPHAIWQGHVYSHGMSLRADGNRAYIADPMGNLLILDTSEIQARKPNPHAHEISRLTWASASIPQNAIPFTEHGHPYLLEFDEYTQATLNPGGNADAVGAGRIIDISNEKAPRVVANLRLAINQPAAHHAASVAGDPGTVNPAQGYAAHYCNIPTSVDPKVVACSFIASGLRVFDISNLVHPKEIAYYVAPPKPRSENGFMASDYAMSQPAFAAGRREIWFTDGTTGFYAVRVAANVWPGAVKAPAPKPKPKPKPKAKPNPAVALRRCRAARLLTTATARPSGHGLRFGATMRSGQSRKFSVALYRVSQKRRVLHPLLAGRFAGGAGAAPQPRLRNLADGYYVAVFKARAGKATDVRRIPLLRRHGRFSSLPAYVATERCKLLTAARVGLPDWGGTTHAALRISFRTLRSSAVTVTVTRGGKLVHRFRIARSGLLTRHLRVAAGHRARRLYRVTVSARAGSRHETQSFVSRKI